MNQTEIAIPVYDVTGTSFVPMITQFTIENLLAAVNEMYLQNKATKLCVDTPLLYRMRKCCLIDTSPNGDMICGLLLIDKPKIKGGGIYESDFMDSIGNVIGKLITREH